MIPLERMRSCVLVNRFTYLHLALTVVPFWGFTVILSKGKKSILSIKKAKTVCFLDTGMCLNHEGLFYDCGWGNLAPDWENFHLKACKWGRHLCESVADGRAPGIWERTWVNCQVFRVQIRDADTQRMWPGDKSCVHPKGASVKPPWVKAFWTQCPEWEFNLTWLALCRFILHQAKVLIWYNISSFYVWSCSIVAR